MEKSLQKKPVKLPDKLSVLIRLALVDLGKAERDPRYKVDMGKWHEPNSHCSVCFAGAVIAFSLGTSSLTCLTANSFPEDDRDKLLALDNVRSGNFVEAAFNFGINVDKTDEATKGIRVPSYCHNRKLFKSRLRLAARRLAKAGL